MNAIIASALAFATFLVASPACAKDDSGKAKRTPPEVYAKLAACRAIADPQQRLSCFDGAMTAFDAAVAKNEVYMVDKKQVRETRRTLFGLPLPNLGIFGDGSDEDDGKSDDAVQELVSTIKHVTQNGNGWVITVSEGSVWQQMDSSMLGLSPKVGGQVTIRRAAMGSYKMNVGKQPAMKVKRIL